MHLQWTHDLSVGVEEIDCQHRELFNRINSLDAAIKKGKPKEEIMKLVGFLDDYVIDHFGTEEAYMRDCSYPDYHLHRKKHKWFKEEFSTIKRQIADGAPLVEVVGLSNNLLITWFSNHIRTVDRSLGVFLVSRIRGSENGDKAGQ